MSGVSGPTHVFFSKERPSLLQRTASVAPHCHLNIHAMPSTQGKLGFPLWAGDLDSVFSLLSKDFGAMDLKTPMGDQLRHGNPNFGEINPELHS